MSDALRLLLRRSEESIAKAQKSAILNLLVFPGVHGRFDSITEAQASTFNWLLVTSEDEGKDGPNLDKSLVQARHQFLEWLEVGEEFFYISGKPGAGKSTLMKFISSHKIFYDRVGSWSGQARILVGRFFFWKPGQPEQKSISGLLRGLLYSILETTPAVSAIAFPELCDRFNHGRLGPVAIKHQDIKQAFENILAHSAATMDYKVILVIDGLDEFEGEFADLLDTLKFWVSTYRSTIKICVSSREYSIFEKFFAPYPKLRLHEFTLGDMSNLVNSRLKYNNFFSSLPTKDSESIVALISKKAEGVFLWVVMVVATIEDGLASGDRTNVAELERSVQLCPTELEDLFPHLLQSVRESYRPWAYKAISFVLFAQVKVPELLRSNQQYPGLGLLDFMLLDETSPKWNLSSFQPRSEFMALDIDTRLEATRKKVLSRCRGFLSVVTISAANTWPANGNERLYAALSHRAIVEFLETEASETLMKTYMLQFDPFFSLFSTVLACLRFMESSNYPLLKSKEKIPQRENLNLADVLDESLQDRWEELVRCGFSLGHSGSSRLHSLLDSVGDAIKRHLTIQLSTQRIRLGAAGASPHQLLTILTLSNRVYEYSEWRRGRAIGDVQKYSTSLGMSKAFRQMICYFQLDDYASSISSKKAGDTESKKPFEWIRWNWSNENPSISLDRFSHLLTEFFERGLDLNRPLPSEFDLWEGSETIEQTPWTCWQMFLWALLLCEIPYSPKYAEFVDRCLRHGADPDVVMFGIAPTESAQIERLTPQDGWVLLVPYTRDTALLETLIHHRVAHESESRPRYSRMPAVLIRDSSPLYISAKENNWSVTLRDLVALWFPQDDGYFSALFEELDRKAPGQQKLALPPLDRQIEVDTGILGTPRGACDMGIYLEEMRVQAGIVDVDTTITREVRVL